MIAPTLGGIHSEPLAWSHLARDSPLLGCHLVPHLSQPDVLIFAPQSS
jgi:hypothetical protein